MCGKSVKDPILDVEALVIKVVAETLGFDTFLVEIGSILVDDLEADSLDRAELIMEIEDAFNLDLPEDMKDLRTVGDIVACVKKFLVSGSRVVEAHLPFPEAVGPPELTAPSLEGLIPEEDYHVEVYSCAPKSIVTPSVLIVPLSDRARQRFMLGG